MKIFLLESKFDAKPWKSWYDTAERFVVVAKDEAQARQMATEHGGDEVRNHPDAWLNPKYSTCVVLTTRGPGRRPKGVVLRDFT